VRDDVRTAVVVVVVGRRERRHVGGRWTWSSSNHVDVLNVLVDVHEAALRRRTSPRLARIRIRDPRRTRVRRNADLRPQHSQRRFGGHGRTSAGISSFAFTFISSKGNVLHTIINQSTE